MLKLGKGIRSPGRDIYSVNFADYLPETLKRDPKMKALAAAVTEQMLGVSGEIDNVLIYSRIDELPEELIDILAFDMHVDWYDYSYPLATKRNVLKNSVKVHKKMGTKYAVETALRAVHKDAGVSEWFEYGGKPYHFKLHVDISKSGMSENTGNEIAAKVYFYKNLRSHCDGIYYRLGMDAAIVKAAACSCLGGILKVKAKLAESIHAADRLPALSSAAMGGILKVKPYLTENLPGPAADQTKAYAAQLLTEELRIKTYVTESIYAKKAEKTVQAGVLEAGSIKIKAKTEKELRAPLKVRQQGHQRMENRMEVKKAVGKER